MLFRSIQVGKVPAKERKIARVTETRCEVTESTAILQLSRPSFIANPENLPLWTKAFSEANNKNAKMVTPNGEMDIQLKTVASKENGTVDWIMTMPDGSIGKAFSLINEINESCIYSFVLLAPPVPLEELEGTLEAQKSLLTEELIQLKNLMEKE